MALIHREGRFLLILNTIIFASIAVLFIIFCQNTAIKWTVVFVCFVMISVFFLFFRVPRRQPVLDGSLVVSPTDGKVVEITDVEDPEYYCGKRTRISIYLNLFNVHITWFPVSGKCVYYKYYPGRYLFAWLPKSSDKNEHTTTVMLTEKGDEVMFRQIAGIIARRIVCYCSEGENFKQGEEAGFIKFGSRIDVFLPCGTKIRCKVGDKVKGQLSVIAEF
ncbi:MAG: phosphatidylserine decarboxylase family protein [Bacteroidales bacterium]|jgi:phosphatidylserine decarboxylase|nr:phosphatidylserine decarboxylase family protein [Bacteroidales bacterium]MCI2121888.1 phosphatidylserine decarboxylase family protein [Bacteroidales bacterium]MCI2145660.1 phosphatidylserine decarboxylase family protein [Bacteroidales bacterium]